MIHCLLRHLCRPLADAAELQNKISDSRDSLKDTKDDVDKRGACSFRLILHVNAKRWPRPMPLNDFRCYIFIASVTVFAALTLCLEHRLGKLRRAVQDASTEFAVADSKKMHLSARLQQDEDEMQALKDKVRYCRRSPLVPYALCCRQRRSSMFWPRAQSPVLKSLHSWQIKPKHSCSKPRQRFLLRKAANRRWLRGAMMCRVLVHVL